ncbi:hypothetical protein ACFYNL_36575 [Streptomyces sp. NPDC007808]|uniref:hypothetical protein n=1 Tax=Streptomyces sp. NPDC007808 TaxID=3364779 RepID=UPI0036C22996
MTTARRPPPLRRRRPLLQPLARELLLDKALDEPIPPQNVPEGLRLRSVTTTEDGVDARFTGRSVTFRPDSSSAQVPSVEVGEGAPGDLVGVVRR